MPGYRKKKRSAKQTLLRRAVTKVARHKRSPMLPLESSTQHEEAACTSNSSCSAKGIIRMLPCLAGATAMGEATNMKTTEATPHRQLRRSCRMLPCLAGATAMGEATNIKTAEALPHSQLRRSCSEPKIKHIDRPKTRSIGTSLLKLLSATVFHQEDFMADMSKFSCRIAQHERTEAGRMMPMSKSSKIMQTDAYARNDVSTCMSSALQPLKASRSSRSKHSASLPSSTYPSSWNLDLGKEKAKDTYCACSLQEVINCDILNRTPYDHQLNTPTSRRPKSMDNCCQCMLARPKSKKAQSELPKDKTHKGSSRIVKHSETQTKPMLKRPENSHKLHPKLRKHRLHGIKVSSTKLLRVARASRIPSPPLPLVLPPPLLESKCSHTRIVEVAQRDASLTSKWHHRHKATPSGGEINVDNRVSTYSMGGQELLRDMSDGEDADYDGFIDCEACCIEIQKRKGRKSSENSNIQMQCKNLQIICCNCEDPTTCLRVDPSKGKSISRSGYRDRRLSSNRKLSSKRDYNDDRDYGRDEKSIKRSRKLGRRNNQESFDYDENSRKRSRKPSRRVSQETFKVDVDIDNPDETPGNRSRKMSITISGESFDVGNDDDDADEKPVKRSRKSSRRNSQDGFAERSRKSSRRNSQDGFAERSRKPSRRNSQDGFAERSRKSSRRNSQDGFGERSRKPSRRFSRETFEVDVDIEKPDEAPGNRSRKLSVMISQESFDVGNNDDDLDDDDDDGDESQGPASRGLSNASSKWPRGSDSSKRYNNDDLDEDLADDNDDNISEGDEDDSDGEDGRYPTSELSFNCKVQCLYPSEWKMTCSAVKDLGHSLCCTCPEFIENAKEHFSKIEQISQPPLSNQKKSILQNNKERRNSSDESVGSNISDNYRYQRKPSQKVPTRLNMPGRDDLKKIYINDDDVCSKVCAKYDDFCSDEDCTQECRRCSALGKRAGKRETKTSTRRENNQDVNRSRKPSRRNSQDSFDDDEPNETSVKRSRKPSRRNSQDSFDDEKSVKRSRKPSRRNSQESFDDDEPKKKSVKRSRKSSRRNSQESFNDDDPVEKSVKRSRKSSRRNSQESFDDDEPDEKSVKQSRKPSRRNSQDSFDDDEKPVKRKSGKLGPSFSRESFEVDIDNPDGTPGKRSRKLSVTISQESMGFGNEDNDDDDADEKPVKRSRKPSRRNSQKSVDEDDFDERSVKRSRRTSRIGKRNVSKRVSRNENAGELIPKSNRGSISKKVGKRKSKQSIKQARSSKSIREDTEVNASEVQSQKSSRNVSRKASRKPSRMGSMDDVSNANKIECVEPTCTNKCRRCDFTNQRMQNTNQSSRGDLRPSRKRRRSDANDNGELKRTRTPKLSRPDLNSSPKNRLSDAYKYNDWEGKRNRTPKLSRADLRKKARSRDESKRQSATTSREVEEDILYENDYESKRPSVRKSKSSNDRSRDVSKKSSYMPSRDESKKSSYMPSRDVSKKSSYMPSRDESKKASYMPSRDESRKSSREETRKNSYVPSIDNNEDKKMLCCKVSCNNYDCLMCTVTSPRDIRTSEPNRYTDAPKEKYYRDMGSYDYTDGRCKRCTFADERRRPDDFFTVNDYNIAAAEGIENNQYMQDRPVEIGNGYAQFESIPSDRPGNIVTNQSIANNTADFCSDDECDMTCTRCSLALAERKRQERVRELAEYQQQRYQQSNQNDLQYNRPDPNTKDVCEDYQENYNTENKYVVEPNTPRVQSAPSNQMRPSNQLRPSQQMRPEDVNTRDARGIYQEKYKSNKNSSSRYLVQLNAPNSTDGPVERDVRDYQGAENKSVRIEPDQNSQYRQIGPIEGSSRRDILHDYQDYRPTDYRPLDRYQSDRQYENWNERDCNNDTCPAKLALKARINNMNSERRASGANQVCEASSYELSIIGKSELLKKRKKSFDLKLNKCLKCVPIDKDQLRIKQNSIQARERQKSSWSSISLFDLTSAAGKKKLHSPHILEEVLNSYEKNILKEFDNRKLVAETSKLSRTVRHPHSTSPHSRDLSNLSDLKLSANSLPCCNAVDCKCREIKIPIANASAEKLKTQTPSKKKEIKDKSRSHGFPCCACLSPEIDDHDDDRDIKNPKKARSTSGCCSMRRKRCNTEKRREQKETEDKPNGFSCFGKREKDVQPKVRPKDQKGLKNQKQPKDKRSSSNFSCFGKREKTVKPLDQKGAKEKQSSSSFACFGKRDRNVKPIDQKGPKDKRSLSNFSCFGKRQRVHEKNDQQEPKLKPQPKRSILKCFQKTRSKEETHPRKEQQEHKEKTSCFSCLRKNDREGKSNDQEAPKSKTKRSIPKCFKRDKSDEEKPPKSHSSKRVFLMCCKKSVEEIQPIEQQQQQTKEEKHSRFRGCCMRPKSRSKDRSRSNSFEKPSSIEKICCEDERGVNEVKVIYDSSNKFFKDSCCESETELGNLQEICSCAGFDELNWDNNPEITCQTMALVKSELSENNFYSMFRPETNQTEYTKQPPPETMPKQE